MRNGCHPMDIILIHYITARKVISRVVKNARIRKYRHSVPEAGLFGNFSDTEQWKLKAYYYQSLRGLPNATTLYYDYSSQHLWDKNIFIQSQYKKEFSRKWVFQASGKWNWTYQHYLDPDYKGTTGQSENSYFQQEYYLSTAVLFRALDCLSFSLSTDGIVNRMNCDLKDLPSQCVTHGLLRWLGNMSTTG